MSAKKEVDHAKEQAEAQLGSVIRMVLELREAKLKEDDKRIEAARDDIESDPLCVEVRSGWRQVGGSDTPEEFKILLMTSGPAVQIIGELNEHNEPEYPRLQFQDWSTPWVDYRTNEEEKEALLEYCQQFYYE